MNLHDQDQADEIRRQRAICGWGFSAEDIASWRDAIDAQKRASFWIKPAAHPDVRAGHVSLDNDLDPPELELANPDRSVLEVTSFFILPEHRRGGLGRAVVATLERYAREAPYGSENCRAVTLTTINRKYWEDGEWRDKWVREFGFQPLTKGTSYEDWYVRMGYVKWKEEPRFSIDAPGFEDQKLVGSFMRKTIA